MTAVTALADGNVLPVAGGILIKNREQELLGAIGISGDLSELDELCAIRGVQSANLLTGE